MGVFGDLIRDALFQAGSPISFWPLAAAFCADVYNLTIAPLGKSKTRYSARYPDRALPVFADFGQLVTCVPKDIEKMQS